MLIVLVGKSASGKTTLENTSVTTSDMKRLSVIQQDPFVAMKLTV